MALSEYITRRSMIATAAAVAVMATPSAAGAARPADADLLALWDQWKALEAERFNMEMEARRMWRERPTDVEDPPRVRVNGMTYYTLPQLDEVLAGGQREVERLASSPDRSQRLAARMLEIDTEMLEAARPVLAEKLRRLAEWDAAVGYQRTLERRDDLSGEAWDLAERIVSIAPTTPEGFVAVLDVLASLRGGMFDPEDDCGDALIASAANTMETATGLKLASLPHCIAYREVK